MMIQEVATRGLSTVTESTASAFTVRLVGSAETESMKDLETFLRHLHEAVVRSGTRQVVVDLRSLEFMNSSCFKTFVTWINELKDTPQAAQYHVRLVSDASKHWQKRSLGALACFAIDLIHLE